MKTIFYIFISFLMVSFAGCNQKKTEKNDTQEQTKTETENQTETEDQVETIRVSNAKEFIKAIGPDRKIILTERSQINLTEYIEDILQNNSGKLDNTYVDLEEVYDGYQLIIFGLKNLTIKGEGQTPVSVVVAPQYSFVMAFRDSYNLHIENINAGHIEGGYCEGGVFQFVDCNNITIHKTIMYGSGTEGIRAENVENLKCTESVIKECTYSIMTLEKCSDVIFENCKFHDNREFSLVNVNTCNQVQFSNCYFYNNKGDLFSLTNNIELYSCKIDHRDGNLGDIEKCIIKNVKNSQEYKYTTQNDYEGFEQSHVIAYKRDSLYFFYNMNKNSIKRFNEEPDPIFNLVFLPDGNTMYYTVNRNGTLWLRKAVFSGKNVHLEDILNLKLSIDDTEHVMRYINGYLLIRSELNEEVWTYSKYNMYSINKEKLSSTYDYDEANRIMGALDFQPIEEDKRFEVNNGQLYYKNNGKKICLTNKINLKHYNEDEGVSLEFFNPIFSPDGTKIAFEVLNFVVDLGHGPLCISDIDGNNQKILSIDGLAEDFKPQWVGNQLLFKDTRETIEGYDSSLYLTNNNDNISSLFLKEVENFSLKQPYSKTPR